MKQKPCFAISDGKIFALILILYTMTLVGCGAGRTMVLQTPEKHTQAGSIVIREGDSPVNVPQKVIVEFKSKLAKSLYEKNGFSEGGDLTLIFRFIQYDPGNQFNRWFWGGIGNSGQGALTVEAVFIDANGAQQAKINAEGVINSGFFGGDFYYAVEKAAQEIVEYAVANFK